MILAGHQDVINVRIASWLAWCIWNLLPDYSMNKSPFSAQILRASSFAASLVYMFVNGKNPDLSTTDCELLQKSWRHLHQALPLWCPPVV